MASQLRWEAKMAASRTNKMNRIEQLVADADDPCPHRPDVEPTDVTIGDVCQCLAERGTPEASESHALLARLVEQSLFSLDASADDMDHLVREAERSHQSMQRSQTILRLGQPTEVATRQDGMPSAETEEQDRA